MEKIWFNLKSEINSGGLQRVATRSDKFLLRREENTFLT